ncbi:MAG TPA: hypothetical protein VKU92_03290 [Acidimicrobiales bacterium]|nr:hypothetical protein [Acidimicrobiales bacterium]
MVAVDRLTVTEGVEIDEVRDAVVVHVRPRPLPQRGCGRGGVQAPADETARYPARRVAQACYRCGMSRVRISTTVDQHLLERAREVKAGAPDSALVDDALAAFLARHRAAEVDAAYAGYDDHPIDEDDEWGDLASFRAAAARS